MSPATPIFPIRHEPELLGQTVVVLGGSAGIGLETARRARAEGAKLILTGRNPERLQRAAKELEAGSSAAFDATDAASLEGFFRDLPSTIDHVMVTAGQPYYGRYLAITTVVQELLSLGRSRFAAVRIRSTGRCPRMIGQ